MIKNYIINLFPFQQHMSKIYLYIPRLPDLNSHITFMGYLIFYIPSSKTEGLYTQNIASNFLTFIITLKGLETLSKST